jgi:hypothetical protein
VQVRALSKTNPVRLSAGEYLGVIVRRGATVVQKAAASFSETRSSLRAQARPEPPAVVFGPSSISDGSPRTCHTRRWGPLSRRAHLSIASQPDVGHVASRLPVQSHRGPADPPHRRSRVAVYMRDSGEGAHRAGDRSHERFEIAPFEIVMSSEGPSVPRTSPDHTT